MPALETTENKKIYAGNGILVAFDFPFLVYEVDHVKVYIEDTTAPDDEAVLKTYITDYTINTAGLGDADGITVTTLVAPTSDENLIVERVVDLTQESEYKNYNNFPAPTVEANLNRLTMMVQQLQEQVDRCLKFDTQVDSDDIDASIKLALAAGYVPTLKSDLSGVEWVQFADGSNITLPAGFGFMVQTSAGVFAARDILEGDGVTITNGDGQAGDVTISTVAGKHLQEFVYWASTGNPTDNDGIVVYQETKVLNKDGTKLYEFQGDVAIDLDTVGAGGLDQGAPQNNGWYVLLALLDSTDVNNPSAMCVIDADFPSSIVLPSGYDEYRRIGYIRTDGSADAYIMNGVSHGNNAVMTWIAGPDNAQVGTVSTTLATYDFSSFVPQTCQIVELRTDGGSAGNKIIRWEPVEGAAAASTRDILFNSGSLNYSGTASIPLDDAQCARFDVDTGTCAIEVVGYVDNLARNR